MKATKRIFVRELPLWPPSLGGAYDPQAMTPIPESGEAIISEVFPVRGRVVTFRAVHTGHPTSYHYNATSEKTAEKLFEVVAL